MIDGAFSRDLNSALIGFALVIQHSPSAQCNLDTGRLDEAGEKYFRCSELNPEGYRQEISHHSESGS